MSDTLTIQNYDVGGIVIGNAEYFDGTLKFPGADTYAVGTILAVKAVSDTVAVAADGGNAGDGTVTAVSPAAGSVPLVGAYNLECTFAVVNGGVFKLEDPNGNIVADNLTMRVGAGLATAFSVAGLEFTITDGATDFGAGDKFSLTVAADGDYVIYDPTGTGGAEFPRAILTVAYTATGASDVPFRPLVKGRVRREKLVIDGGGTVTDAIVEQLRDYMIIAQDVDETYIQDNQ
jgi:hypothetical protein